MVVLSVAQLAQQLGATINGGDDALIDGVATLSQAGPTELSFLANPKYQSQLQSTNAGVVLLRESDVSMCRVSALVVDDPYLSYAKAVGLLFPKQVVPGGVHPRAVVDEQAEVDASAWVGANVVVEAGAKIAAGAQIGPGCVIGRNTEIGSGSVLHANVTLYAGTSIGERVIIHSGAVLGSDGFGFANEAGHWVKIQQVGRVIVGHDVEIGANCTLDCGAIGDTVIEDGVKLDNLIQIAHNVRIGAHTAMAGHTAVAGSTTIGKYCAIGGAVGIVGHLKICDNVTVTAMSLVSKSISKSGVYSSGMPAEANKNWNKRVAHLRQLEQLSKRVCELEK